MKTILQTTIVVLLGAFFFGSNAEAKSRYCGRFLRLAAEERFLIGANQRVLSNEEGMRELQNIFGSGDLNFYGVDPFMPIPNDPTTGKDAVVSAFIYEGAATLRSWNTKDVRPALAFIPGSIDPQFHFYIRASEDVRILEVENTKERLVLLVSRTEKETEWDGRKDLVRKITIEKTVTGTAKKVTIQNMVSRRRYWSLWLLPVRYWHTHTVELSGYSQNGVTMFDENGRRDGGHFDPAVSVPNER